MFAAGLGEQRNAVTKALAAAGVVAALFSLVYPPANRPIWIVLTLVTLPIGFVLSHVVMAVLFFCVFAPIGALLRALGKDPIERGPESGTESYWQSSPPRRDKARYFRPMADAPRPDDDFEAQVEGERASLGREFLDFLMENKKWWLAPIVISVLLLGALVFFGGSAAAPFIYTLF
jgi:hypothetical protein